MTFHLVYELEVQTMLDAMLDASDAQQLTQYAEEARQLTRIHITKQQGTHAQR